MQEKTYKSPLKKLVKFFEKSRDNWKNKYFKKKKELKRATNRIYEPEFDKKSGIRRLKEKSFYSFKPVKQKETTKKC